MMIVRITATARGSERRRSGADRPHPDRGRGPAHGRDGDHHRGLARGGPDPHGLGIDLRNVTTLAELQDGVDEADRVLGLRVVDVGDAPADGARS